MRDGQLAATAACVLAAGALASGAATAPAAAATPPQAYAGAPARARTRAPVRAAACVRLRPTRLTFKRALGQTTGVLRWQAPRAQPAAGSGRAASRARATGYRVTRGGAVVGQTRKRAMRVRISLGRRQRLRVVALDARGRTTRCAGVLNVREAHRGPTTPRFPAVAGDEAGLRVTWQASTAGDAELAGYRLLRDGAVVGQTRATSWDVAVQPNRRYRFQVVAVDATGRTSAPSDAVTASTDHAPPTPPGELAATPVSESAIHVAWRASSVRAGRVVGYRVLRDGAVVRQLDATATTLENLAPSTRYGVEVVALDDHGYVSAPARAEAATEDPEPTTGHAHAYLLASTDQSFADFRAHYRQIGVVHPTYYDCTGAAALVGADDPLVTRWAQARRVEVLPRANCQRTAVVERIVTDPATRAFWIDRLAGLAAEHGYDGISLDFEAGPASARPAFSSFVEELAGRLHADGRKLAVAVSPKVSDSLTHPRSGIFDYPRLAAAADYVFVMAWGLHWSSSAPGPQDDITWVRQIAEYVASLPEPHKFVFGTNLYTLDWPDGGGAGNVADAYEYLDLVPSLPQLGAEIALDPVSDNWRATYVDAAGRQRQVWWPDATTTARRVEIAKAAGFGGFGVWRLGREDQRIWEIPLLGEGVPW